MPYFNWQGITLHGNIKRGKILAATVDEVDALLFKRDIALLSCKAARLPYIQRAVTASDKIQFFKHLAVMLEAGVLLPEALITLASTMHNQTFKEVLDVIAISVVNGQSFSYALQKYPHLFNPLIIHIISAGQDGRSLCKALHIVIKHLEVTYEFRKRVKAAMLMPCITFLFFAAVVLIIMIGIIPQFAALFATFGSELPPLTRMLIRCSEYMQSSSCLYAVALIACMILIVKSYCTSEHGKSSVDVLLVRLPCIGVYIQQAALLSYMQSLGLLIQSGFPLPHALQRAQQSMGNQRVQKQVEYLAYEVQAGTSLSAAMLQHPDHIFDAETCAMIHVGQETGQLDVVVEHVCTLYQTRIHGALQLCATLLAPALMIFMGLLITLLVFAVYLPILQFSHIVH